MNRDAKAALWTISIALVVLVGLVASVIFFYAEENARGKRAWDKCKADLAAKGETLDWKAYIPPPVPGEQNFFKAPKMAEWFIKSKSANFTNELAARLTYPNTNSVVMAELIVQAPSTHADPALESSNLVLRYSSFGKAIFLPTIVEETNMSSPDFIIPIIQMEEVPLTTVVENLARQANINYVLDPKTGYNHSDQNGQIKPEPTVSVRWNNITGHEALLALLNQYDLQLVEGAKSNVASVTIKSPAAPPIYVSPAAREKIEKLFQNVIGANAIGSQGFALLAQPLNTIKPVRIVLQSERTPNVEEIVALFTQFFPNKAAALGSPKIRVEWAGTNSFRVVLDADSAADYLAWSDQFEPDFNRIREALKLPYARMDGDYNDPFTVPLPDFSAFRALVQTLAQRVQCYLLLGQPEKALRELTLINDARHPLEFPPTGKLMTMVATMLNVAVVQSYTDTVADGFRLKAWREPQLIALQEQLKEVNLSPFLIEGLREERAWRCSLLESLASGDPKVWRLMNVKSRFALPKGWLYQNSVTIACHCQQVIDSIDPQNHLIRSHDLDKAMEEYMAKTKHFRPYTFYAAMTIPNYSKAIQTLAYTQTLANEAQIICALERYRLAHGGYPEKLDALVPQFIAKLPHDIIGGPPSQGSGAASQPLHYRRTADGKFLLYSVGWNETDDGGQVALQKDGSVDREKGDWVWRYPAN